MMHQPMMQQPMMQQPMMQQPLMQQPIVQHTVPPPMEPTLLAEDFQLNEEEEKDAHEMIERIKGIEQLRIYKGHTSSVNGLCKISEKRVVSCSADKSIKVWPLFGKKTDPECTLKGHNRSVLAITKLRDGTIATSSMSSHIRTWKFIKGGEAIKTGNNTMTAKGHTEQVTCLSTLTKGNLVSGSHDNTIK